VEALAGALPNSMNSLRSLPSVDQLLHQPRVGVWIGLYGRPLTLEALRTSLQAARENFALEEPLPGIEELLMQSEMRLKSWTSPSLIPVINATGVVLHTNLGRAPLSRYALQAVQSAALGYSNLEYDLHKGGRGSRLLHAEGLLKRLLGVDAALVVNNNAAALLLTLAALARRKGVVIARSQLIEIGGGFRVPDVMKQSGARLVEVGATNRVHLEDYIQVIEDEKPALLLHAHRSNFAMIGFTGEPSLAELTRVASRAGIPLVDDLGSGALLDTTRYGLGHEPTVQESLDAGADLVCFSGDKLLGGPQAGIIIGRADLVARLKKHPLARALRADKLCLAALSATLLHYLKDEAEREIPVWRMICLSPDEARLRAQNWSEALGMGAVIPGHSTVGGGSLPAETLDTFLLALHQTAPNRFLALLRQAQPPIIARLQDDQVVFDPRTVLPEEEPYFLDILQKALAGELRYEE
jgi:L-seryl-tRNA(Ser) seleniumtransferase